MIRRLQHVFALSEKGAKDFVKAVLCNISLMLPVGAVMAILQHLLACVETGRIRLAGFSCKPARPLLC